jgi:hypothetical protein
MPKRVILDGMVEMALMGKLDDGDEMDKVKRFLPTVLR